MTEQQVLDIILHEFRAQRCPLPPGLEQPPRHPIERLMWHRISRRIVDECQSESRRAARLASLVGFSVTRGRTRL